MYETERERLLDKLSDIRKISDIATKVKMLEDLMEELITTTVNE